MQSKILLFYSVFFYVIFSLSALEYSNRWTVQIDGDNGEADRLARKHGFMNQGKVLKALNILIKKAELNYWMLGHF